MRDRLLESLTLASGVGDQRGVVESMEMLALLASRCGDQPHAVRVHAAASELRRVLRTPQAPVERRQQEVELQEARELLGDAHFERRWNEGLAWPSDQRVELATMKPDGADDEP